MQLEEDRGNPSRQPHHLQQNPQQRLRPPQPPPYSAIHNQRAVELGIRNEEMSLNVDEDQLAQNRPEAVTRALRVLQVNEIMAICSFGIEIELFTGARAA